jgi:nicotinamide N-methyltransferase
MRDYLTLSWARFSKDVQSHTLQISKILAHPAPRAGELIKLDASLAPLPGRASGGASGSSNSEDTSLEVIARFPGGLDFGRGLVDINFTMWPLFKCLNIDNVLTACEVRTPTLLSALPESPQDRVGSHWSCPVLLSVPCDARRE